MKKDNCWIYYNYMVIIFNKKYLILSKNKKSLEKDENVVSFIGFNQIFKIYNNRNN